MKPYNPDALCPMCGHAEITTGYCTNSWMNDLSTTGSHTGSHEIGKTGRGPKHLDRRCKRCGFEWIEAPVESKEEKHDEQPASPL